MRTVTSGRTDVPSADVRHPYVRRACEGVAVAGVVRVAIRVLPLPRVLALLEWLPRVAPPADAEACVAVAAAGAARLAHPTCLYRSLVAFGMLARRGVPVAFHLGARKSGPFEAHAWISVAGQVVGDEPQGWAEIWRHDAVLSTRS